MLRNHFRNFIVVILLFLFAPRNYCQTINHKFLVSDVKQLAYLLETAHLVIDSMLGYREMYEERYYGGWFTQREYAEDAWRRYYGTEPPSDYGKLAAGLPAATDVFRELVKEMKTAGTKTLLVDLRKNKGGDSSMTEFLIYFLFGKDKIFNLKADLMEIKKYSNYYFERNPNENLDEINEGRTFNLTENDYDFTTDFYTRLKTDPTVLDEIKILYETSIENKLTFKTEYQSENYDGYYCPEKVIVLCSPNTFSSGFSMMQYLYRAGAVLVGTPSGQAANCFGNIIPFTLKYSLLNGYISIKKFTYFHDNPEKGRLLRPDYELTYEKLVSYGFDKNAGVIYALELVN